MRTIGMIVAAVVSVFAGVLAFVVGDAVAGAIEARTRRAEALTAIEVQRERAMAELAIQQANATSMADIWIPRLLYLGLAVALGLFALGLVERYRANTKLVWGSGKGMPLPRAALTAGDPYILEQAREINQLRGAERLAFASALGAVPPGGEPLWGNGGREPRVFGRLGPDVVELHDDSYVRERLGLMGAAPALTAEAEAPELPTNVPLAPLLRDTRPGTIVLGVDANGDRVEIPFGKCFHLLGVGQTGAGKSVLLDNVIVALHKIAAHGTAPVRLYGADYKRELRAKWGQSPLFIGGILTDPREIAQMLEHLLRGPDGVLARFDKFEQATRESGRIVNDWITYRNVTGETLPLTVALIDEQNVLFSAAKKSDAVVGNLIQVLQTGRAAGVNVFSGMQYLNREIMGRDGSQQYAARALLGTIDPIAARVMYGDTFDPKPYMEQVTGVPGRGLFRSPQQANPIVFQSAYAKESDILDAIALVQPDGGIVYEVPTPSAPVAPVPAASATGATVPMDDRLADKMARIEELKRAGVTRQTDIIKEVWGVNPGGGPRYKQAVAEYQSIVHGP